MGVKRIILAILAILHSVLLTCEALIMNTGTDINAFVASVNKFFKLLNQIFPFFANFALPRARQINRSLSHDISVSVSMMTLKIS